MKLIHVYSNNEDYAAEDFSMMNMSYERAFEKAKQCEDGIWEFQQGCFIEALDFSYDHLTDECFSLIKECLGDRDLLKIEDIFLVNE